MVLWLDSRLVKFCVRVAVRSVSAILTVAATHRTRAQVRSGVQSPHGLFLRRSMTPLNRLVSMTNRVAKKKMVLKCTGSLALVWPLKGELSLLGTLGMLGSPGLAARAVEHKISLVEYTRYVYVL